MRKFLVVRSLAAVLAGSAFAVVMSGCGVLSIESWVVVKNTSSGSVSINGGTPIPLTPVEGGFLGLIQVNTNALPGPLSGPITVEDIRIATNATGLGEVCIYGNPAGSSTGSVNLNVLAGTGSASLNLDILATALGQTANLKQSANLALNGVSLTTLLAAASSGSADGLFATSTSFTGNSTILGLPVAFTLNLDVTNTSAPPLFSTTACNSLFNTQTLVPGLFYGVNSKADYLTVANGDNPQPPVVINLSDLGAGPGSVLHLTRIGTFADALQLKDGSLTKVSGVFSSSNTVLGTNVQNRIPDAIASGLPAFVTPPVFQGFRVVSTDIPNDFLIDVPGGVTVTVPAAAQYLIVAPFSPDLTWGDNSGFGLGVAVDVQ